MSWLMSPINHIMIDSAIVAHGTIHMALLHGDLRAPNFILTSSGVFIIDFGLSRFVEPGQEKELELEMNDFRSLIFDV